MNIAIMSLHQIGLGLWVWYQLRGKMWGIDSRGIGLGKRVYLGRGLRERARYTHQKWKGVSESRLGKARDVGPLEVGEGSQYSAKWLGRAGGSVGRESLDLWGGLLAKK